MRIDTLRWNCEFLRCICIIGILSIANIVSTFLNQLKEEQLVHCNHGCNISFSPDIYFLYTTITSLETSPLIGYKYRQQNTPLIFSLLYS